MVEPIGLAQLSETLVLGSHEHISLVGGGGKTTALFAFADQLGGTVVLTTTTKMGRDRTDGRPVLFSPSDAELATALDADRTVLAWGADGGHKAVGVEPEVCDRWFTIADNVVVEADGSRRRPFKAPRPYEPVVPSTTTVLVACVGADALGRVIADQCQRPLRVAAVAGCSPYVRLTPERLATVLESDRGSRKDCPPSARFAVMINRVTVRQRGYVDELADLLRPDTLLASVEEFSSADDGGRFDE